MSLSDWQLTLCSIAVVVTLITVLQYPANYQIISVVRSFVHLLLRAGFRLLWTLVLRPMHQPRERRGIGRCVQCVCVHGVWGEGGLEKA